MAPLSGFKVVDATRLLPGGFCTMILSDLGAEVVKVEEPGIGDYMRMTPPTYEGTSLVDDMVNRNKRSVGINLKCEEGKEILRKIIAKSDVFVEGFRPGVIDRLGFSFDKVRKINSRIVYCSISAFGRGSRLSNIPGHDLNFEAMSGILAYGSSPEIPYVQYADLCAGVYAAIGVIASLHSRHYGATRVDVPIVQSLMSWMIIPYSAYLATNVEPRPGHSLLFGSEPYYELYQTLDGKRVAVAAIEEEFWLNLLRELNLDELKDMRAGDRAGREKLKEKLRQTFARKTRDDWGRLLMDKETCTTPVLDFTGALRSAWTGSLRPIGWSSQKRKSFTILGTPLRFSKQTRLKNRPAPKLGEDTARVLKRLGYSVSRLRALRERQVVA